MSNVFRWNEAGGDVVRRSVDKTEALEDVVTVDDAWKTAW